LSPVFDRLKHLPPPNTPPADALTPIWVREGHLPCTTWAPVPGGTPEAYVTGLNAAKQLLETWVRESGNAIEVYSRTQVDALLTTGLNGLSARLLSDAILEPIRQRLTVELAQLDDKIQELNNLRESIKAELVAEIQSATDAALAVVRAEAANTRRRS
jgi:hypothetical protein